MSENVQKPKLSAILRNRDFTSVFTGGLISDIGSNFTFIAIMFFAIDLTSHMTIEQSAQAVALIMVIQIIPSLIIGPFAGVFVDRFDRKKIMVLADVTGALTSLSVLFASSITHLYIFSFFTSLARLFFYPARGASIPRIVSPDQLVQANGLTQTMTQLSSLIGPAIAGIIVYRFGFKTAFIIDGASYFISAIFILSIRTNLAPQNKGSVTVRQLGSDMKEGLVLVIHDKIIFFILGLFFILLLGIGMINPLLAFYLQSKFGLSEQDFGLIASFSAVSGFLGAILITIKGEIKRKLTMIVTSTFIVSIALFLLGYAPYTPFPVLILYIAMAFIGIINISLNIPLSALFQAIIEDKNMGKINSFMGTALAVAQITGAGAAAYLAGFFAINNILLIVSGFTLIIGLVSLFYLRIKNLEEIAQERESKAIERKKQTQEIENLDNGITEIRQKSHQNDVTPISGD